MKKIIFLLPLIAMLVASCSNNSYTIKGAFTTNTYEGQTVYLQVSDTSKADAFTVLDSAVIKDNKFILKGKVTPENNPMIGFVSVGKIAEMMTAAAEKPVATIVLEPGEISLTLEETSVTVGGTALNDDMQKIHGLFKELALLDKNTSILEDEPSDKKKALIDSIQSTMFSFAKANAKNKAGEHVLLMAVQYQALNPEQYLEIIAATDTTFRANQDVQQLQQYFKQVVEQQEAVKKQEAEFLNKPFLDANLMTQVGKEVKLSDYVGKGKYVLIDFWASWCRPCLEEIPNMKEAYAEYKSKGFEIIGISIDERLVDWHHAIDTYKMNWVQLSDAQGQAANLYKVVGIPCTFLVAPDGNIIAMNLRGNQLQDKLQEVLSK